MTIGERIKERRKELDISVDKLAEILGKNRATIYRYESDDIENLPTSILEPLAKALNTTPAHLMGWDQDFGQQIDYQVMQLKEKHSEYKTDIKERATDTLKMYFYQLNNRGREEAIKRVEELTYIPAYCRDPSELTLLAAHPKEGATEEDKLSDIELIKKKYRDLNK